MKINGISGRSASFVDPHSQRCNSTMRLIDESENRPCQLHRFLDWNRIENRRIKRRSFKGISEPLDEAPQRFGPRVKRYGPLKPVCYLPKVIDAMAMIGVIVGDDDMVDRRHIGREQLLPEVRPAVDQQLLAPAFDQNG
jgi:hypothetical protein